MSISLINEKVDKLVIEGLSPTLIKLGFKLYKKRIFKRNVEKCTNELNILFRRIPNQDAGYVSVCPGIIYDELESMASELEGVEPRKGWPIAAANIGNLKPEREFIEWPITCTTDITALAEQICNHINDFGVPFWESFSSISGLVKGYESKDPRLTLTGNEYRWRMAASYCILGNKNAAKSLLESWDEDRPGQKVLDRAIRKISIME